MLIQWSWSNIRWGRVPKWRDIRVLFMRSVLALEPDVLVRKLWFGKYTGLRSSKKGEWGREDVWKWKCYSFAWLFMILFYFCLIPSVWFNTGGIGQFEWEWDDSGDPDKWCERLATSVWSGYLHGGYRRRVLGDFTPETAPGIFCLFYPFLFVALNITLMLLPLLSLTCLRYGVYAFCFMLHSLLWKKTYVIEVLATRDNMVELNLPAKLMEEVCGVLVDLRTN